MTGDHPDMSIREATVDDAQVLDSLEHQARAALVDARGGRRRLVEQSAIGEGWADLIAGSGAGVAVAELDGQVFGWLVIRAPDAHGVAVIDSVHVSEGARELGLGDDLVEWALAWARRHRATSVESWALPGDRDTKNLFERNGLTARLITVSRELSGPASSADASR